MAVIAHPGSTEERGVRARGVSRAPLYEPCALWGNWLGMGAGRRSGHYEGTGEGLHCGEEVPALTACQVFAPTRADK